MKKFFTVLVSVALLVSVAVSPVWAGGGQVQGDNGQGTVGQGDEGNGTSPGNDAQGNQT